MTHPQDGPAEPGAHDNRDGSHDGRTAGAAAREGGRDGARYHRWEQRTRGPLLVAAVLFLVVLCLPVVRPHPGRVEDSAYHAADYAIWAVFTVDYLARLALAPQRWLFVRTHLPDLLVVAVPAFRPLRLVRLVSVAQLAGRRGRHTLLRDLTRTVVLSTVGLVALGAIAELDSERHAPHATITSLGDAVWWAASTVTTVGYGDRYPVTVQGRLVAAVLMFGGVGLVTLLTAAAASWLVRQVSRENEIAAELHGEAGQLAVVVQELAALRAEVALLRPPPLLGPAAAAAPELLTATVGAAPPV